MDRHFHDVTILSLVLNGDARERLGRVERELRNGSVLIKPAGEVHTHEYGRQGLRMAAIELSQALAVEWIGSHAERVELGQLSGHPALNRIRLELQAPDDLTPISIKGAVLEIMTALLRARRRSASDSSVAARAREFLHDFEDAAARLPGLASLMGVSQRRLDASFRAAYGCTPAQYCRSLRFSRAVRLIAASELPFAAVAAHAGYCDQAHMTRDFARRMGKSPGMFRRGGEKIQNAGFIQDSL